VLAPSVMPEATVTEHSVPAFSVATWAAKLMVAPSVPEPLGVTVKVVVPHPDATGAERPESVAPGSTTAMVSLVCTAAFNTNLNVTAVAVLTTAFASSRLLVWTAGAFKAVDTSMPTAGKSATLARTTLTVR
jgi:hypothetical protein